MKNQIRSSIQKVDFKYTANLRYCPSIRRKLFKLKITEIEPYSRLLREYGSLYGRLVICLFLFRCNSDMLWERVCKVGP